MQFEWYRGCILARLKVIISLRRAFIVHLKKTEESKAAKILIAILVVMLMALAAVTIWEMLRGTEIEPDITYPMTNQHITWTGAGYGG